MKCRPIILRCELERIYFARAGRSDFYKKVGNQWFMCYSFRPKWAAVNGMTIEKMKNNRWKSLTHAEFLHNFPKILP